MCGSEHDWTGILIRRPLQLIYKKKKKIQKFYIQQSPPVLVTRLSYEQAAHLQRHLIVTMIFKDKNEWLPPSSVNATSTCPQET